MTAAAPTFEAFAKSARARGCDEVVERVWPPNLMLETHTHSFAVEALVVAGELALSCDGATRLLRAGDTFELAREVPHAERYGAAGAVVWVARRHTVA
jgi:hypothetical protein